jgi:hypothetical protein
VIFHGYVKLPEGKQNKTENHLPRITSARRPSRAERFNFAASSYAEIGAGGRSKRRFLMGFSMKYGF